MREASVRVKEGGGRADSSEVEPVPNAARTAGCPSCGAMLRPDAPWCTLCYADLRPAPVVAPAPLPASAPVVIVPRASYGAPAVDPLTAALSTVVGEPVGDAAADPVAWPCTACGYANSLERDTCLECGAGFLAAVRDAQRPTLVLPVVGDLTRMSRPRRLGLAAAAVLLLLLPIALLSLVQTGKMPAPRTAPAATTAPAAVPPGTFESAAPAPAGLPSTGSTGVGVVDPSAAAGVVATGLPSPASSP